MTIFTETLLSIYTYNTCNNLDESGLEIRFLLHAKMLSSETKNMLEVKYITYKNMEIWPKPGDETLNAQHI